MKYFLIVAKIVLLCLETAAVLCLYPFTNMWLLLGLGLMFVTSFNKHAKNIIRACEMPDRHPERRVI